IWIGNVANQTAKELERIALEEKRRQEARGGGPWNEQWERGKIYEVGGGLSLQSRLAVTDDQQGGGQDAVYRKVFLVRMNAGTNYPIRMNARPGGKGNLDPMLHLEDPAGKILAVNDDAPGEGTLNSRIDFRCPNDGVYRVIATNLRPRGTGDF